MFSLAKEIYGAPWFMDAISMQHYSQLLNDIKAGQTHVGEKHNPFGVMSVIDTVTAVTVTPNFNLEGLSANEKYISVIELNGPITRDGGQSHYGTKQLAAAMLNADKKENIIGHIIKTDSGGGSARAVEEFIDAFGQINKPIVAWIDGMAASAAYYIISYADYIIAHRNNDMVGSIGTLIEYQGFPAVSEDKTDGFRRVRIYADSSFNKNKDYEEAINNLNFRPVVENILNPFNAKFIIDVRTNRANVSDEEITGHLPFAFQTVDKLIDAIGPFSMAVAKVVELYELQTPIEMTKEELKNQSPEVYAEIFAAGVASERDRVEALLTYADVDLAAVTAAISNGETPTQKFYAEMARKGMAKDVVNQMTIEAPAPVAVAAIEAPAQISELEVLENAVFVQLGLTK